MPHFILLDKTKHSSFFDEQRKDPITGDNFQEGDEIVLCASCKSAFLRDSWEYMGGMHCNQNYTLTELPTKTEKLTLREHILFFRILRKRNRKSTLESAIPSTNSDYWIEKQAVQSPLASFFYGKYAWVTYVALVGVHILGLFYLKHPFISFATFGGYFLAKWLHDKYYEKKIATQHKDFESDVFYITRKGIGFSTKYGFEEKFLEAQHIDKIVVKETSSIWGGGKSCTIYYGHNYKTKCKFDSEINTVELEHMLDALYILSEFGDFPIEFKVDDNYKTGIIERIQQERNAKFLIDSTKRLR